MKECCCIDYSVLMYRDDIYNYMMWRNVVVLTIVFKCLGMIFNYRMWRNVFWYELPLRSNIHWIIQYCCQMSLCEVYLYVKQFMLNRFMWNNPLCQVYLYVKHPFMSILFLCQFYLYVKWTLMSLYNVYNYMSKFKIYPPYIENYFV